MYESIPELAERLAGVTELPARIDIINRFAWTTRMYDPARSRALAEETRAFAGDAGEGTPPAYPLGLAVSLGTLAFLDNDVGNYAQSLARSMRVLELLEGIGDDDPEVRGVMGDTLATISRTYFGYGDFGTAAEYGMKALEMSRALGDALREARVLTLLGNVYAESNDVPEALRYGEAALALYRKLGHVDGEAVALNNVALTYLQAGDGPRAVESSLEALRLARAHNVEAVQLTALSTVAEIQVGVGDLDAAESVLREAMGLARARGARYDELMNLLSLGKLSQARGGGTALATLEEALAIAVTLNDRAGEFQCHRLLAEVHESQGNAVSALRHYKQYHALKESVSNEIVAKRLAGLQVVHQVEQARRDAEIQYLKTVELHKEIEERKATEAALEALASIDPLTGILNRRLFLARGEALVTEATGTGRPLTAILLDIDHFKRINDTHGHGIGDQALIRVAGVMQENLREGEIIGRYGGDEFGILLPGSRLADGQAVAERLRARLAEEPVVSPKGVVRMTLSQGLAELGAETGANLDALLERADRALYAAKRAGRDRQVAWGPGVE